MIKTGYSSQSGPDSLRDVLDENNITSGIFGKLIIPDEIETR